MIWNLYLFSFYRVGKEVSEAFHIGIILNTGQDLVRILRVVVLVLEGHETLDIGKGNSYHWDCYKGILRRVMLGTGLVNTLIT